MSTEQSDKLSYAKPVAGDILAGKYRIEHVLGNGGIDVAATRLQLE